MLPKTKHIPANGTKLFIRIDVPASVRLYLLPPELRILLWPSCMNRTAVPEASIHKHSDTKPKEDNVSHTTRFFQYYKVDTIAHTPSV